MRHDDLVSAHVGLGCGRLKGGFEKKASVRLVHTALDLGVRHFDVAPAYGLGLAEAVLGQALAGRGEGVVIATKVGIPRPRSRSTLQAARALVKPVARMIPGLRSMALKALAGNAAPRRFDRPFIEQSFRESLNLLQRDAVDLLLLHEPSPDLDFPEIRDVLDAYVGQGLVGAYGSSTGDALDAFVGFGSVAQYRCPVPGAEARAGATLEIVHGALRFVAPVLNGLLREEPALRERVRALAPPAGDDADRAGALAIAYVLAQAPDRLLVSTNSPDRLATTLAATRRIVACGDWRPAMQALRSAAAARRTVAEAEAEAAP